MIFIALALLMLLAAAAAVVLPLWRGAATPAAGYADPADATLRQQLEELERDLASGSLAEADYQNARRDMLAEFSRKEAAAPAQPGKNWRRASALAAALFILITAPLLYWKYGNWRTGVEGVDQASVPAVEQMVAGLAERLHTTDGNDLQGWVMLGHSYVVMNRYADAVDAYSHAHQLAGDGDADVLSGYAEALTLADPAQFMDKALPLFEKALQLDPANPQALWYGGLGAFERGDKQLAVRRWQALLQQDPPQEYRQIIEKYIVEAGGSVATPKETAAATGIRIHVSLAPALNAQVQPGETLFVFALPMGAAGGPPLAARRFQAGELPLDLTLTDRDSPIPGRTLSGQTRVVLIARVSISGAPEQQPGDFLGQTQWDAAGGKPAAIVIDTVVK
ncbi:MAG TPA: c-type cytochrome biogenesis protein CcmI [Gammaproteobacteria bacterium]|nr:c-type cytochrome biogenesis protein CcmI [Gammaproteobacteria bacterium]